MALCNQMHSRTALYSSRFTNHPVIITSTEHHIEVLLWVFMTQSGCIIKHRTQSSQRDTPYLVLYALAFDPIPTKKYLNCLLWFKCTFQADALRHRKAFDKENLNDIDMETKSLNKSVDFSPDLIDAFQKLPASLHDVDSSTLKIFL